MWSFIISKVFVLDKVELEAEPTKGEQEDPEGNDDELDTDGLTNVKGVREEDNILGTNFIHVKDLNNIEF